MAALCHQLVSHRGFVDVVMVVFANFGEGLNTNREFFARHSVVLINDREEFETSISAWKLDFGQQFVTAFLQQVFKVSNMH